MLYGSHAIFACNFKLPSPPVSTWLQKMPPGINMASNMVFAQHYHRFGVSLFGKDIWCIHFPAQVIITICYCPHFKLRSIETIWLQRSLTTQRTLQKKTKGEDIVIYPPGSAAVNGVPSVVQNVGSFCNTSKKTVRSQPHTKKTDCRDKRVRPRQWFDHRP